MSDCFTWALSAVERWLVDKLPLYSRSLIQHVDEYNITNTERSVIAEVILALADAAWPRRCFRNSRVYNTLRRYSTYPLRPPRPICNDVRLISHEQSEVAFEGARSLMAVTLAERLYFGRSEIDLWPRPSWGFARAKNDLVK